MFTSRVKLHIVAKSYLKKINQFPRKIHVYAITYHYIIIFVRGPKFNKKRYVTWATNDINALFRFPYSYINGYRKRCLTMLVFQVPNLLKTA